jgi:hypothetical protein
LGLVPVSFGYKEISLEDFKKDKASALVDFSYLCTFGLRNKLNQGIVENISTLKYGSIVAR